MKHNNKLKVVQEQLKQYPPHTRTHVMHIEKQVSTQTLKSLVFYNIE